jgi:formate hydrogenlyase subunit 4
MVKLIIYCALLVNIFIPWHGEIAAPLQWLVFWVKIFALVLLVTLVAATHARYRIDQAIRFFALLLVAAVAALVLAGYGF